VNRCGRGVLRVDPAVVDPGGAARLTAAGAREPALPDHAAV